MRAEEKEVAALLGLDVDNDDEGTDDNEDIELEYVPDSEGDLLLSPPAGLRSPYGYR